MAKDSSFDVVSEVDRQEVDNALNQARKELQQRYDFKGTGADIEWKGDLEIEVHSNSDHRTEAALEVFKEKLIKRGVSTKAVDAGKLKETGGGGFKYDVTLNQGIKDEKAREINKAIKGENFKSVQVAIQGEQLRVSAKSRDALQEVIGFLKEKDFGIPLQFTNYR